MAKGSRGGRRSALSHVQQTNAQPINNAPVTFGVFDDNDAQKLRDDMTDIYDPDVTDAIKLYISDSNPNGDGYSHSQNLNYKLDNGIALNATEKFIDDNIQAGMHEIGKDSQLVRYCHDDILKACGVSDYTKMTDAQLQKALVGVTMQTTSYLSTSYDAKKSPFAPGAVAGGGREVIMNINARSNTKMVFGAKKQAEIVINKGTNMKITGVHFDGSYATPRNSSKSKERVVIDVETF